MNAFIRTLLFSLAVLAGLFGCCTPSKRAQEHTAAFRRLPPEDQRLVLKGRVRKGLGAEAVLIAWGEPDTKTRFSISKFGAGKEERTGEEWTYNVRFTIRAPMGNESQWAPNNPFTAPGGTLLLGSAFGDGGPGHDGWLYHRPRVQESGFARTLTFINGRLDEQRSGTAFYSFP